MTDREILDAFIIQVRVFVKEIRQAGSQARETAGGESGCSVWLDVLALHGEAMLRDPLLKLSDVAK